MKKVLSILVVVLALTLALGCFAFADEFAGEAGYEEAALYKWDGTTITPALPASWTANGETFDHYEEIKAPTCADTGIVAAVYLTGDPKTPTVVHEIEVEKLTDESAHQYLLTPDKGATCGEKGSGRYICAICGKDKGVIVNMALVDHQFGDWVVKKAATCLNAGVDYRICKVCLKTEERDSNPKNHAPLKQYVFSKYTVEPTEPYCDDTLPQGYADYVCPVCKGLEKAKATITVDGKTITAGDTKDFNGQDSVDNRAVPFAEHTWGELDVATVDEYCEAVGSADHQCIKCGKVEPVELAPKGHEFELTEKYLGYSVLPTCEEDGYDVYWCKHDYLPSTINHDAVKFPGYEYDPVFAPKLVNGILVDDYSKNLNPAVKVVVIPALGHDLNDWDVAINPTIETNNKGYWTRTCKHEGCTYVEEFKGTQEEFDAFLAGKEAAAHADDKNGLINEDGEWKYYKDDVFQSDFVGMVSQDGCDFFVADGKVCMDANGLNMYNDEWYFLSLGRVCAEHTGLALYDGCWFFITNGKLDTSVTGLVDYNGGTFVFADGRLIAEYSGLYFDGTDWYFAANGQIQKDFSGSVEYDGETFVLENGKLVG